MNDQPKPAPSSAGFFVETQPPSDLVLVLTKIAVRVAKTPPRQKDKAA